MKCSACNFDNPEGSKFCGQCGQQLAEACPACREPITAGMKFCVHCGEPLTSKGNKKEAVAALHSYLLRANGEPFVLEKEKIVIGRLASCDMVMASPQVSAKHARLDKTPGGYTITDLGSTNGTYVNDQKTQNVTLRNNDRVKIGPEEMVFFQEPGGSKEKQNKGDDLAEPGCGVEATQIRGKVLPDTAEPPSSPGFPYLEKRDGGVLSLDKEKVIIGGDDDCDIVLQNLGVSGKHAVIEKTTGGYLLTDLESINGTFVNGCFTSRSILKNGDRLVIGTEGFTFREPSPPPVPSALEDTGVEAGKENDEGADTVDEKITDTDVQAGTDEENRTEMGVYPGKEET